MAAAAAHAAHRCVPPCAASACSISCRVSVVHNFSGVLCVAWTTRRHCFTHHQDRSTQIAKHSLHDRRAHGLHGRGRRGGQRTGPATGPNNVKRPRPQAHEQGPLRPVHVADRTWRMRRAWPTCCCTICRCGGDNSQPPSILCNPTEDASRTPSRTCECEWSGSRGTEQLSSDRSKAGSYAAVPVSQ